MTEQNDDASVEPAIDDPSARDIGLRQADKDRARRVRDLRLAGFPRRLDKPMSVVIGATALQAALHAFDALREIAWPDRALVDTGLIRHLYVASFFVFALAIPVGCFFWMRWLDWSVKNRIVESEGRFERTPSSVVWAYFVPVLNAYRPLTDLRSIWRNANRFGGEAPTMITVWWVVTLGHLALMVPGLLTDGIGWTVAASSVLGVLSNGLALVVLHVFWQVQPMAGPPDAHHDTTTEEGAPA